MCCLVIVGVRPDGTKELVALEPGYRESTESWAALLRDLRDRGAQAPVLATGDGSLGFWAALRDVFPETAEQRCWVHKTANVLDALPKRMRVRVAGRPTLLPPMERPPWSTLGLAIDYRLRYYFAVSPPAELAAAREMVAIGGLGRVALADGGSAVVAPGKQARPAAALAGPLLERLLATTDRLVPAGRRLGPAGEAELCRLCYVLALYEELFRGGRRIGSPLDELPPGATLADLLCLARPQLVDDLCGLSWAFYNGYRSLLSEPAVLNPTFAGSPDVGGADAGLIVGPCLVEITATKAPAPEAIALHQLLGYALLDYDDRYRLEEAAIYLARQAVLVEWSLGALLETLSGGGAPPLAELRPPDRRGPRRRRAAEERHAASRRPRPWAPREGSRRPQPRARPRARRPHLESAAR